MGKIGRWGVVGKERVCRGGEERQVARGEFVFNREMARKDAKFEQPGLTTDFHG